MFLVVNRDVPGEVEELHVLITLFQSVFAIHLTGGAFNYTDANLRWSPLSNIGLVSESF